MGLDYSISFEIRKKNAKESLLEIEVAYWRKCWGLAYELNEIARRDEFRFDKYEYEMDEWHFRSNISIINEVINVICAALPNRDSNCWDNSLWEVDGCRAITARELSKLIQLQSFLDSKYEYKNNKGETEFEYDYDILKTLIDYENESYYRKDENKKELTDEIIQELRTNPDLELIINFYFSY